MKLKNKSIYLFLNDTPDCFTKLTTIPNNIAIIDQMKFISYGYNRTITTYQLLNKIETLLINNKLFDLKEMTYVSLSEENKLLVKAICLLLTNRKYLSLKLDDSNSFIFNFLKKHSEMKDLIFGIESDKLFFNENFDGYFINNTFFENYDDAKFFLQENFEKTKQVEFNIPIEKNDQNLFDLRFNLLFLKRNYFFITNTVRFYRLSFCLMAIYGFFGFYYLNYFSKFRYNLKEEIDQGRLAIAKFSYIKNNALAFYVLILSICVTGLEFITLIMKNKKIYKEEIKQGIYDVKELMFCVCVSLFIGISFLVFCFVGVHNNYNIIFRFFDIFYNTTVISLVILQYVLLVYLLLEEEFLTIIFSICLFILPFLGKYFTFFKLLNLLPPISMHFFYIKSFFKGIKFNNELMQHDEPFWNYLNNIF